MAVTVALPRKTGLSAPIMEVGVETRQEAAAGSMGAAPVDSARSDIAKTLTIQRYRVIGRPLAIRVAASDGLQMSYSYAPLVTMCGDLSLPGNPAAAASQADHLAW